MKLINQSARSFIVRADEVIKGGEKGKTPDEKIIVPGSKVVEVSSKLGKFLKTYTGIMVLDEEEEAPKKGK